MPETEPSGSPARTDGAAPPSGAEWEDLCLRLESALEQNRILRAELRRVEAESRAAKRVIAGFNAEEFRG